MSPDAPRRARRSEGRGEPRKKRRGNIWAFLLVSAVPVGAIVWYALHPAETQSAIASKFEGGGGRAAKAGILFGVLLGLSLVALPAFHNASGGLKRLMERMRATTGATRLLLYPVEFLVWLLWFATQLLFAIDAILILACGALVILFVMRIVDPTILQDFVSTLPEILR